MPACPVESLPSNLEIAYYLRLVLRFFEFEADGSNHQRSSSGVLAKIDKRIKKLSTDLWPTIHSSLMPNRLIVWLTVRLILEDRHRTENHMMDDPVNLPGLPMTDDPSFPMRLPKAAHLPYNDVVRDR